MAFRKSFTKKHRKNIESSDEDYYEINTRPEKLCFWQSFTVELVMLKQLSRMTLR